jgi:hypothetical protein
LLNLKQEDHSIDNHSSPAATPDLLQLNAETGATAHFLAAADAAALQDLRPATITVHLPDGSTTDSRICAPPLSPSTFPTAAPRTMMMLISGISIIIQVGKTVHPTMLLYEVSFKTRKNIYDLGLLRPLTNIYCLGKKTKRHTGHGDVLEKTVNISSYLEKDR